MFRGGGKFAFLAKNIPKDFLSPTPKVGFWEDQWQS
jgi:hypothetical protein